MSFVSNLISKLAAIFKDCGNGKRFLPPKTANGSVTIVVFHTVYLLLLINLNLLTLVAFGGLAN